MKRLVCCLFVLFTLLPVAPLSAAPDRFEKQEAAAWMKEELARLKTTHALLKRVKDEKSAGKSGKALLELYKVEREKTAMGETGPALKPAGEAMDAAEEKYAARMEKSVEAIRTQLRRIEALGLESSVLAQALGVVDDVVAGYNPTGSEGEPGAGEP